MSEPKPRAARDSAVRRQARLRALSAAQRDSLGARWQQVEPTLNRIDSAVAGLRRLREHPVALALLAVSASGLITSRRGRRMLGVARASWRFGLRAATVFSLWRAVRPPSGYRDPAPRGEPDRSAQAAGNDLRGAAAPRASVDAR